MKRVIKLLPFIYVLILVGGCNRDDLKETIETEVVNEESETSIDKEQYIEYDDLYFGMKIDDEQLEKDVIKLISDENDFIIMLDTEWPQGDDEQYQIDGRPYLMVNSHTWSDYEKQAETFYSTDYVNDTFNSWYLEETKTFVEKDGILYRAMSDAIGIQLQKDSIRIWKIADGLYYITLLVGDEQSDIQVYIIKAVEEKEYGFEIINKFMLYNVA